jgi:hypothetical protein
MYHNFFDLKEKEDSKESRLKSNQGKKSTKESKESRLVKPGKKIMQRDTISIQVLQPAPAWGQFRRAHRPWPKSRLSIWGASLVPHGMTCRLRLFTSPSDAYAARAYHRAVVRIFYGRGDAHAGFRSVDQEVRNLQSLTDGMMEYPNTESSALAAEAKVQNQMLAFCRIFRRRKSVRTCAQEQDLRSWLLAQSGSCGQQLPLHKMRVSSKLSLATSQSLH